MNAGPKELNEAFVRSLPDNGPVVMVNLLQIQEAVGRWRRLGVERYQRYSKAISPLLKGVGRTILWAGTAEGAAYGDLDARQWEFVVLMRCPSRKNLFSTWGPRQHTRRPTCIPRTPSMIA